MVAKIREAMKKTKAFTLTEIILVVVLIAVILIAIYPYIRSIHQTWTYSDRRSEMLQHARVALDKIVRDIRNAKRITEIDPSIISPGQFIEIINQDYDTVTIFHNVDNDNEKYIEPQGDIQDNDLVVQTEDREGNPVYNVLAKSVDYFRLYYLKDTMDPNDEAEDAEEVVAVRIDMRVSDPEGILTGTIPVTSLTYVRAIDDAWAARIGQAGWDTCREVHQTKDGGFIACGQAGSGGVYLAKINKNGKFEWSKIFRTVTGQIGEGESVQEVYRLENGELVPDGFVVSAKIRYTPREYSAYSDDVVLIKTDESGDYAWSRSFGFHDTNNWDYSRCVRQIFTQNIEGDPEPSGFMIAGSTQSTGGTNFSKYYHEMLVIKTDNDGYVTRPGGTVPTGWIRGFGPAGASHDFGFSIRPTFTQKENGDLNGFITIGHTYGFVSTDRPKAYIVRGDTGGKDLWSRVQYADWYVNAYDVQQTFNESGSSSGFIVTGTYPPESGNSTMQVYLLKTNDDGTYAWSKTFGKFINADYGQAVQQTADGGYIVAGWSTRHDKDPFDWADAYLIKTDKDGAHVWSKLYGSDGAERIYSVEQTIDGGYILAGSYSPPSGVEEDGDMLIVKTDAFGNCNSISKPKKILDDVSPNDIFNIEPYYDSTAFTHETSDSNVFIDNTAPIHDPGEPS